MQDDVTNTLILECCRKLNELLLEISFTINLKGNINICIVQSIFKVIAPPNRDIVTVNGMMEALCHNDR